MPHLLSFPDIVSKEVTCKEVQLFDNCLTFKHMFTLLRSGIETTTGASSAEAMAACLLSKQASLSAGAALGLYSH